MIKAWCHTNLDAYQYAQWPTVFAIPPQIGHRVRAQGGSGELYIVAITHGSRIGQFGEEPYLSIELHNAVYPK